MLCDICKKNEARIYYTEIINGEKKEQHLCEECAAGHPSISLLKPFMSGEPSIGSLLSGLLGGLIERQEVQEEQTETSGGAEVEKIACSGCGMRYGTFLDTGLFGCGECYKNFGSALRKTLKTLQGADTHTGKAPQGRSRETELPEHNLSEIERMTIQLRQAVEREEYEEAARLRDLIKAAKQETPVAAESEAEHDKMV